VVLPLLLDDVAFIDEDSCRGGGGVEDTRVSLLENAVAALVSEWGKDIDREELMSSSLHADEAVLLALHIRGENVVLE
jgi:hypothetical protein